MQSTRERFDAKWVPEANTGCWLWTASLNWAGYGQLREREGGKPKIRAAHRVAWTLYRGPIPEGMFIDHLCRVRSCVNPDHLRVVTPYQNSMENSLGWGARAAKRTHCAQGHPFDRVRKFKGRRNGRRCSVCGALNSAAQKQKLKAAKLGQ